MKVVERKVGEEWTTRNENGTYRYRVVSKTGRASLVESTFTPSEESFYSKKPVPPETHITEVDGYTYDSPIDIALFLTRGR